MKLKSDDGKLTDEQVEKFINKAVEKGVLLDNVSIRCGRCGRPLNTICEKIRHAWVWLCGYCDPLLGPRWRE